VLLRDLASTLFQPGTIASCRFAAPVEDNRGYSLWTESTSRAAARLCRCPCSVE
jgi:hypothetical protein